MPFNSRSSLHRWKASPMLMRVFALALSRPFFFSFCSSDLLLFGCFSAISPPCQSARVVEFSALACDRFTVPLSLPLPFPGPVHEHKHRLMRIGWNGVAWLGPSHSCLFCTYVGEQTHMWETNRVALTESTQSGQPADREGIFSEFDNICWISVADCTWSECFFHQFRSDQIKYSDPLLKSSSTTL